MANQEAGPKTRRQDRKPGGRTGRQEAGGRRQDREAGGRTGRPEAVVGSAPPRPNPRGRGWLTVNHSRTATKFRVLFALTVGQNDRQWYVCDNKTEILYNSLARPRLAATFGGFSLGRGLQGKKRGFFSQSYPKVGTLPPSCQGQKPLRGADASLTIRRKRPKRKHREKEYYSRIRGACGRGFCFAGTKAPAKISLNASILPSVAL